MFCKFILDIALLNRTHYLMIYRMDFDALRDVQSGLGTAGKFRSIEIAQDLD